MNTDMTIRQLQSVVTLAEDKGMDSRRMKKILSSGVLADLFDKKAKFGEDTRREIQEVLGFEIDRILTIDRTSPYAPTDESLSIVEAETDTRSIELTEIDMNDVGLIEIPRLGRGSFVNCSGDLKKFQDSPYIRLDVQIAHTLMENQHLIPTSWKMERERGYANTHIIFGGTVLEGIPCTKPLSWPVGSRAVFVLNWSGKKWFRQLESLGDICSSYYCFAFLRPSYNKTYERRREERRK